MPTSSARRIRRTVGNGLRLRCPRCGGDRLFRGLFAMKDDCAACLLHYEREAGYFVGAIYINYAVTSVFSIGGYFALDAFTDFTLAQEIVIWGAFSIAFPLWFFRYARSLWLALDHVFSPEPVELRAVRTRHGRSFR